MVARALVRSLGDGRRVTGRIDRVEFRLRPCAAGDLGRRGSGNRRVGPRGAVCGRVRPPRRVAAGRAADVIAARDHGPARRRLRGLDRRLAPWPLVRRASQPGRHAGLLDRADGPLARSRRLHRGAARGGGRWRVSVSLVVGPRGAIRGGRCHPPERVDARRPGARGRNDGAADGDDPAVRLARAAHAVDAPDARAAARPAGLAGLLLHGHEPQPGSERGPCDRVR